MLESVWLDEFGIWVYSLSRMACLYCFVTDSLASFIGHLYYAHDHEPHVCFATSCLQDSFILLHELLRCKQQLQSQENETLNTSCLTDFIITPTVSMSMYLCLRFHHYEKFARYVYIICTRSGARFTRPHSFYPERVVSSVTKACAHDNLTILTQ